VIKEAFREAGVLGLGQTLKPEDTQNGFTRLNWMLAQWARKRWMVYALKDYPVVTTGKPNYTVGPSGDINIPERPDKLHSAFLRFIGTGDFNDDFDNDYSVVGGSSQVVDFPLGIIPSRQDYNLIAAKAVAGQSGYVYYEPDWPLGMALIWPVAAAARYELQLTFKTPIGAFASINDSVNMPSEYFAAIHYGLTQRLAAAYRKTLPDSTLALLADAMQVVQNANTQVPILKMPTALRGNDSYRNFIGWWS
jgi:hypothetical protein